MGLKFNPLTGQFDLTGSGGGGGGGSVTSVGLSLPSIFNVSGSPVTGSGTLTGTLADEPANTVFAGPVSGPDATPTFRALVVADIPALPYQPTLTFTAPLVNTANVVEINGFVNDNKLGFQNAANNTKKLSIDLSQQTASVTTTLQPALTQNTTLVIRPLVDTTGNLIVQNATTGQIFIGADASIGGANSGIQYSNAVAANRGQIRVGSYFNGTSVAGVTTATSRSGTVGVNAALVAGQDYSKWTAQAAATTAGSLPISGSFAFKANSINSLTVPTDYHIQLTNLAGTLADRLYLTSEGILTLPGYGAGVLQTDSGGLVSSAPVNLATSVTGVLPEANGGTNQSTYTTGDILYASASNTLSKRSIGSTGKALAVSGGVPQWVDLGLQTNTYYIDGVLGNDTTGTGSSTNPYATINKAATVIGGAVSNSEFNDATKRYYCVKVAPGVYTESVTFGTRPFIHLEIADGVNIVGNVTVQIDQGAIFGAGLQQPSFTLSGPNTRGVAGGAASHGITGDLIYESINTGSSSVVQMHVRSTSISGKITKKKTAPAGGYTLTLFIDTSIVQGVIEETTGDSGITLYADNCNDSGTNSLGAVSGSVILNVINDVRFNGAVVTTAANHGRWFNTEFKSGQAHNFTGFSGTVSTDANSYESFQANVPTKGTGTFTLLDSARGTKYTPAVSGDWSPTPAKVDTALDQLAARTAALTVLNNKVYYVSTTGNDANVGYDINKPFLTLSAALTAAGTGNEIAVLPGTYAGNYTITNQNVTISSFIPENGGLINFTGTFTISHTASSVRLFGITVDTINHTNAGSLYLDTCKINTALSSSGAGYLEVFNTETQGAVSITGTNNKNFVGNNKIGTLGINNASALVNVSNNILCAPITLQAGTLGIGNTPVYSATGTSNAITVTGATSVIIINNVTMLTPTNTAARISIAAASFYNIRSAYFDKVNSTLSGTVVAQATVSDLINAASYVSDVFTASRALATNSSKQIVTSATTDTELGFVSGVTSSIQTQLNSLGTTRYRVELFTLNGTDISNKFVTLATAPVTANLTQLTVIGGPLQDYGTDFTVSGTQLSWSGLFLDGVLVSGDKLVVTHN